MKKHFIIFIFLTLNQTLTAQEDFFVKKFFFKVNLLTPGLTFEKGLFPHTTFCIDANLSLGFSLRSSNSSSGNSNFTLLTSPFLRGQYRYYYNLEKRKTNGKNISNNSGNFLAISTSYYFRPINNEKFVSIYDGFTIGGIWGFQKTYLNNFNISANGGLGYNFSNFNNNSRGVMPILNFTIGWVIGK